MKRIKGFCYMILTVIFLIMVAMVFMVHHMELKVVEKQLLQNLQKKIFDIHDRPVKEDLVV